MTETATLSGREIEVKQLTIKGVRDYITYMRKRDDMRNEWEQYETARAKQEAGTWVPEDPLEEPAERIEMHTIDMLYNDIASAKVVSMATGLSMAELEGDHDPKEMRELIDKVKAANPFLVAMMDRYSSVGNTKNNPS